MKISDELVQHIAHLARLEFEGEQIDNGNDAHSMHETFERGMMHNFVLVQITASLSTSHSTVT